MKYYVTLMNTAGVIEEHSLDLNIPYDIKWQDFVTLPTVQTLLRERPSLELIDITPEDMLYVTATPEHDEHDEVVEDDETF